jgi:hypothetical protein
MFGISLKLTISVAMVADEKKYEEEHLRTGAPQRGTYLKQTENR